MYLDKRIYFTEQYMCNITTIRHELTAVLDSIICDDEINSLNWLQDATTWRKRFKFWRLAEKKNFGKNLAFADI